jgi:hypothetical protein
MDGNISITDHMIRLQIADLARRDPMVLRNSGRSLMPMSRDQLQDRIR